MFFILDYKENLLRSKQRRQPPEMTLKANQPLRPLEPHQHRRFSINWSRGQHETLVKGKIKEIKIRDRYRGRTRNKSKPQQDRPVAMTTTLNTTLLHIDCAARITTQRKKKNNEPQRNFKRANLIH